MILLIVDDEKYTREGINAFLPWQELGIDRVEEADDGAAGYEKALRLRPDIILSDVVMPKMNGIDMMRRIREILPDVSIIFMSAYSDKRYLQSAIELSAVNYVEKPINLAKLTQSIRKIVSSRLTETEQARQLLNMKRMLENSLPVLRSEIALQLAKPGQAALISPDQLKTAFPWLDTQAEYLERAAFISCLFDHRTGQQSHAIMTSLESLGYHAMMAVRDDSLLIVHICLDRPNGDPANIDQLADCLLKAVCRQDKESAEKQKQASAPRLALGSRILGICNIAHSSRLAENAWQRSFYRPNGPVASAREAAGPAYHFDDLLEGRFRKHLNCGEKQAYLDLLEKLRDDLRQCDTTPVDRTKTVLTALAGQIIELSAGKTANGGNPSGLIAMGTLDEAMDGLKSLAADYFDTASRSHGSHIVVEEICRYIEKHYPDQNLSLGKIASEIHMSPAHLCVLFKKGQRLTLNQYLTQYRISKAKGLLADLSYRIKDVAGGVGFSDCNYFIKVFKKETGHTPMEFREIQYHENNSKKPDHSLFQ